MIASLLGLLLLAGGCDDGFPDRYPTAGKVRFKDGSPVKTGTVELGIPGNQWTASGKIDREGRFVLSTIHDGDGAIAGKHKVVVRQVIIGYLPAEGGHDHGDLVDEKYSDYRTTDLSIEIFPRENELELVLDKKTEQPR